MIYKLYKTIGSDTVNAAMTVGVEPQVSFIFDPDNSDYQEYLKWVAEGGVPLPPDSQE
jgi:predicted metalloendopeptidase